MSDTTIRPFTLDIPQADLDDLRARLDNARWPNELPGDVDDGIEQSYVRALYDYWRSTYDWRRTEEQINALPQFTTDIDGQNVHFLHVRSPEPNALPLIVTHGWPGSILEFMDIVGPLTDPAAHGGDPADAFDLVIPSIPGYGLSGPTHERGWNNYRIAGAWVELMRRLGYERYGAVGNDAGSMISPEVGRLDPDHVVGVHVTQIFSFPSGDPTEFEGMTPEEMTELGTLQWFFENKMSFNKVFSEQPQTVAYAITDSPLGLLAWNAQLLGRRPRRGVPDRERDALLADEDGSIGRPAVLRERPHDRPPDRTDHRAPRAGRVRRRFQRHPPLRRARPQQHRQLEHVPERRPFRGPQGTGRTGRRYPGLLPRAAPSGLTAAHRARTRDTVSASPPLAATLRVVASPRTDRAPAIGRSREIRRTPCPPEPSSASCQTADSGSSRPRTRRNTSSIGTASKDRSISTV